MSRFKQKRNRKQNKDKTSPKRQRQKQYKNNNDEDMADDYTALQGPDEQHHKCLKNKVDCDGTRGQNNTKVNHSSSASISKMGDHIL